MPELPAQRRDTHIELSSAVAETSQVSVNVGQQFITTTRDKTELALMRYESALRARDQWIAPAGIFLAVLPSLLGAQFVDFLGVEKQVWKALYLLAALGSGIWLIWSAARSIRLKEQRGIEQVIKEMREGHVEN